MTAAFGSVRAHFVAILIGGASVAYGQTGVEGRVVSNGQAVPYANVGVRGTTYGTSADIEGRFGLARLPAGTYTLVASAVGFTASQVEVHVPPGVTVFAEITLEPTVIETDGVVVTGTMVETHVRDSPVKVDVVSARYLQRIPTANVMEVLENVNGLTQQIDCAVCGTNNIRINGMDGPYTAVLIDGMPIMSSLATVYGLNGISPSLIQQVEVIKGPISTLYGTEAMGGVINIITKNPQTSPRFAINTFRTTDAEMAADVGIVPTRGRLGTLISGTFFYNNRYLDGNDDGFADLTLNKRASLFGKVTATDDAGRRRLETSARYYSEDRVGGTRDFVEDFSDALRGSDQVYGETIRTNRFELLGTYRIRPAQEARVEFAFNHHDQDSYYGDVSYQARQSTAFTQLVWPLRLGGRHAGLVGATVRAQRYDDNTGSTGEFDHQGREVRNRPDDRISPGAFVQHEFVQGKLLRLLTGGRVDYQRDHGLIASPRLSVKLSSGERTTFRLNGGTGFRVVNLFTEDHAAYTGARATVILEDLAPERSYSATASLQHVVPLGADPLTIDLDGFYTYFTNKIEPNYGTPGVIAYENLSGSATTRGVSLTLSQSMTSLPISYTVGATVMDVFLSEYGERRPLEFAPEFQGVANLTARLSYGLSVDYTANVTGPMKLPEYDPPFDRAAWSPTYSVHNLQLTKEIGLRDGTLVQLYIAIENLFDYTQVAPLVDPEHPFGDHFDTAYVYGPIHGRCGGLGVRVTVP